MFHHESTIAPDRLPAGALVVHRTLTSYYQVYDATDPNLYSVKRHYAFTSEKLTMSDVAGNEVATMTRPPMHLHPTFTVSRVGHPDVVIRKANFAQVNESWRLEGGEQGDIDIHGDFLDHEFTFVAGDGQTVATASRRWVTLTQAFVVQPSGLDPVLALAAAIGIDFIENTDANVRHVS